MMEAEYAERKDVRQTLWVSGDGVAASANMLMCTR